MYFPAFSMFDETGGSPNAAISPAVCWSSISCRVDAWSSEMDVASSGGNRCVAMVYCMTPNFKMNNTRWWQWHHISMVSWYLWISQHPSTSHLNQYFGGTSHILQRLLTPHGYYMRLCLAISVVIDVIDHNEYNDILILTNTNDILCSHLVPTS